MTVAMLAILLISITTTTGIVFYVFSSSYSDAVKERVVAIGQSNTTSFLERIEARQNEIRYVASLDDVKNLNEDEIEHLLTEINENNGFYDLSIL